MKIIEGLTKKVGREEALKQHAIIAREREVSLSQLRVTEKELLAGMSDDPDFRTRGIVEEKLGKFIKKWNYIDTFVGHGNNTRGAELEVSCADLAPRIVMKRLGITRARVLKNLLWDGVPGEVDMAILNHEEKVSALIEIKANFFDIACGFEQSGPGFRAREGKLRLISPETPGKLLEVGEGVPCFVVTCLPPHDYHLGAETRLRERLHKMANDTTRTWTPAEILAELRERFSQVIPPAQWLVQNGKQWLLII